MGSGARDQPKIVEGEILNTQPVTLPKDQEGDTERKEVPVESSKDSAA